MQFEKTGDGAYQRRLPGAIRTENGDDLSFADRQIDPGQNERLTSIADR